MVLQQEGLAVLLLAEALPGLRRAARQAVLALWRGDLYKAFGAAADPRGRTLEKRGAELKMDEMDMEIV